MNSDYYVNITSPETPGVYCETNLRTTDNSVEYGGVDPTDNNSIVGVVIPSVQPDDAFELFLAGLVNMEQLAPISTLLFNFQRWTDEQVENALEICTNHGFTVRYARNNYQATNVPLCLIVEDTAHLMPEARVYLRVDDDLKVLHKSPVIAKSGGTQYLEMIHYAIHHPRCGYISTTGTIGKLPPRHYLGPHPTRGLHMFIMTGLGAVVNNMGIDKGCLLPYESLTALGAVEDGLTGAYRINHGFYTAKYNHVRALHRGNTDLNDDEADIYGWAQDQIIEKGVGKFIRETYNPEYDWKRITSINSFTYDNYNDHGGIPIWEDGVTEDLTKYYPPVSDEVLESRHEEIIQEIKDAVGDME